MTSETSNELNEPKKIRRDALQIAYDDWHKEVDYRPFLLHEPIEALKLLPSDEELVVKCDNLEIIPSVSWLSILRQEAFESIAAKIGRRMDNTRNLWRAFIQTEGSAEYRLELLSTGNGYASRSKEHKLLLQAFKEDYDGKQPVHLDPEDRHFKVLELWMLQENKTKMLGRTTETILTILDEIFWSFAKIPAKAPTPELIREGRAYIKKIRDINETDRITAKKLKKADEN